jgi:GNAT superfamily N-acetyltransferase
MVEKLVTYLEMRAPAELRPAAPVADLHLVRITDPGGGAGAARIRELHDAIATPHLWSSLGRSDEAWRGPLTSPKLTHWVAVVAGADVGWGSLAVEDDGSVQIASFGLRPEAVGQGFGGAFLTELVRRAWQLGSDVRADAVGPPRVWLHTSSWDHPHALANYEARGFTVTRRELQQQRAGSDERATSPVGRPPEVLVRPAVADDAGAAVELLGDLGYARSVAAIRERLTWLASSPTDLAAVAVRDGADVVGLVTAHVVPMFAEPDPAFLRITALSVAPRAVRRGVGRRLVGFAEYVARLHGCRLVEVSSGRRAEREAAHRFYRTLGFEDAGATSARYWKRLSDR